MIKDILKQQQPVVYQTLKNALDNDKIAHAYMFSGPSGTMKKEAAYLLAQSLICETEGFACETCNTCKRIAANEYVDVKYIDGSKTSIKKDDIIKLQREVLADPIYNSKLVTKLINSIMLDGKKGLAQSIIYGAFKLVEEKTKKPALEVFDKAVENITPSLELKVRRVAGANVQVPTEVSPARKQTLVLRWLTQYARLRNEKTMTERLANEIIDASNGTGASVKKKEDTHKMAEANKAFAHLRW